MPSDTNAGTDVGKRQRHVVIAWAFALSLMLVLNSTSTSLAQPAAPTTPAKVAEPDADKQPAPQAPVAAPDSTAEAEDVGINTPSDWPGDSDMALTLSTNFRTTLALDGAAEKVGAAAFVKPQTGAVYVEWLRTGVAIEKPVPMIRTILDKLREEPTKAALGDDGVTELEYKELKAGEVVEARLGWRHIENETLTVSRTLVWQNKDKILRVVRASCVFAESDREKLQKICQGSLVSLTSDEIDKGELIAFGPVPATGAASTPKGVEADDSSPGPPGPTIGTPSSGVLYADANAKPEESKTGRWIFVVGALLIVFAIYSLTRARGGGGGGGGRSKDDDEDEADEDEADEDEADDEDDRAASPAEEEE